MYRYVLVSVHLYLFHVIYNGEGSVTCSVREGC